MIFVTDISSKKIAPGQSISVFGGFFDTKVGVSFGDHTAAIVECEDDLITAIVPDISGDFDVRVSYDGSLVKTFSGVSVVSLAETPNRNPAKDYTADDFDQYIRSLFPRGIALSMWRGSNLSKLVASVAYAFKYVWSIIRSMMVAVDPTHTSNFDEWEEELSLPEVGIAPFGDAGRRAEIHRVECTDGGCSKNYFKKILGLMNKDAEVYEYTKNPGEFSGVDFGSDNPRFYFKILFYLTPNEFIQFRAGESGAGDFLNDFTQYKEESVFKRIKPSHTKIIFGYAESKEYMVMSDNYGKYIVTSDGKKISYYIA